MSTSAPAPAAEDKQGQRTSSRIKSRFQVRETATEHVSSSAADESQPKHPILSHDKSPASVKKHIANPPAATIKNVGGKCTESKVTKNTTNIVETSLNDVQLK